MVTAANQLGWHAVTHLSSAPSFKMARTSEVGYYHFTKRFSRPKILKPGPNRPQIDSNVLANKAYWDEKNRTAELVDATLFRSQNWHMGHVMSLVNNIGDGLYRCNECKKEAFELNDPTLIFHVRDCQERWFFMKKDPRHRGSEISRPYLSMDPGVYMFHRCHIVRENHILSNSWSCDIEKPINITRAHELAKTTGQGLTVGNYFHTLENRRRPRLGPLKIGFKRSNEHAGTVLPVQRPKPSLPPGSLSFDQKIVEVPKWLPRHGRPKF